MEENSYFSLSDILATNARIPCVFTASMARLGQHLDPSSESESVPNGAKLDLPLWMAQCLIANKAATVQVPGVYRESQRNIVQADANVVDLHQLGPYYYDVAAHVVRCKRQESNPIAPFIVQTFKDRFRQVMDLSRNCTVDVATNPTRKLDQSEKRIFHIGLGCRTDLRLWEEGKVANILPSAMVATHRKRKRTESFT